MSDYRAYDQPSDQPSLLERALGLGLRAGALFGLNYAVAGLTGRNPLAAALHYGGSLLQAAARAGGEGLASTFAGRARQFASGEVVRGSLLVRAIREAQQVGGPGLGRFAAAPGGLQEAIFQHLQKLGSAATPSRWYPGYSRLTVEAALARPGLLRQESRGLLTQALERGWIEKTAALDPKIYQTATGKIRDVRLFGSYGAEMLSQLSGMFGIPQVVRSLFPERVQFAALPHDAGGKKFYKQFYVGGNVYGQYFGKERLALLHRNYRLGLSGDPLQLVTALREGGAKETIPPIESGLLGWADRALAALGLPIGRRYGTRYSRVEQFLWNPLQRWRALKKGEAVVATKPLTVAGRSELASLFMGGYMPELEARAGSAHLIRNKAPWMLDAAGAVRPQVAFKDLPLRERLAVLFGTSKSAAVVGRESFEARMAERAKLPPDLQELFGGFTAEDLLLPPKRGAFPSIDSPISKTPDYNKALHQFISEGKGAITAGGSLSPYERSKYYAYKGGFSRLRDFLNYAFVRLNSLASETLLGIGFKPSSKLGQNILRVSMIPFAYEAFRQIYLAADYSLEKVTGFSPIKGLAWAYTRTRLAQQALRDALGITAAAQWSETNFPGSVDSGASFILRTGAVAGGLLATMLTGRRAYAALGLAGTLLVGGPGLQKSRQELAEEYSGQRLVEVRKNRFWALGYQPFFGGKISHYEPSWYHKLMNDANWRAYYGSKDAYFAHQNVFGVPLPTPWNLFGIKNLTDPYWLENARYYDRPYPITAGMLDEYPILGPLLSDTIGRLIKPRRTMHGTELAGPVEIGTQFSESSRQPPLAGKRLQIETLPAAIQKVYSQQDVMTRLNYYGQVATYPAGVYEWVMSQFIPSRGHAFERPRHELADAMFMSSLARQLQEADIGGFAGQTELIRRFLFTNEMTPAKMAAKINPIRNTQPTWLPGNASEFRKDRESYIDFHTGDAYTKLPAGEFRLPGPAYESLFPLHSTVPGVYDQVDRLLILADVAPYSEAFSTTARKVWSMWNRLEPEWQAKVQQALDRREAKKPVNQLGKWRSPGTDALTGEPQTGALPLARRGWMSLMDLFSEVPIIGTKFGVPQDPLEQYRESVLYGAQIADWSRPWSTIVRPYMLTTINENPFTAGLKGATSGFLLSTVGRTFSPAHFLSSPNAPLVGAALGSGGSLIRSLLTGRASGGYTPGFVEEERELDEYFSYIKYAKMRNLQERAAELGEGNLMTIYAREARRTIPGAQTMTEIRAALPRMERPYFDAFKTAPPEERAAILDTVSPHMGEALQMLWSNGKIRLAREDADQKALKFFQRRPAPPPDWIGWHPDMAFDAIKIKMLHGGVGGVATDIHRFGYYPQQDIEVSERYPMLDMDTPQYLDIPNLNSLRLQILSAMRGSNMTIRDLVDYSGVQSNIPAASFINISRPNSRYFGYMRDLVRR